MTDRCEERTVAMITTTVVLSVNLLLLIFTVIFLAQTGMDISLGRKCPIGCAQAYWKVLKYYFTIDVEYDTTADILCGM